MYPRGRACFIDCALPLSANDESRAKAKKAAEREAKEEEQSGGLAIVVRDPNKPLPTSGAKHAPPEVRALVLRGEDVMTQVTNGLVCLLRVRGSSADHMAALGYCEKVVDLLSQSVGKEARYGLMLCCVRVIEVSRSSSAACMSSSLCNSASPVRLWLTSRAV